MDQGDIKSVAVLSRKDISAGRAVILLAAILLACLAVRVWLVCHTETIAKDGVGYIAMARQWSVSPAKVAKATNVPFQPGYAAAVSWMHGLVVAFGGPTDILGWDLAGQITSVVSAVAATLALWLFASALMGRRIALIAALLFSLTRKWSAAGADVIADSLSVCLQMWAMVGALWTLRLLESRRVGAMLMAVAVGLVGAGAYYVRLDASHVVVPIAICWLVCSRRGGHCVWALVAMFGTMAAGVVPYMFYIGAFSNDAVFGNLLSQAAVTMVACVPVASASLGGLWGGVVEFIRELFEATHPVLGFAICVWLVTWVGGKVLRSRLLRGMAGSPRRPAAVLLVGSLATMGIATITNYLRSGYLSDRYPLANAAMLAPLAGGGILVIVHWICVAGGKLRLRVMPRLAMVVVVALVAISLLCHTLRPLHKGKGYIKQAGLFIAQEAGEDAFLLTDNLRVRHYAQIDGAVLRSGRGAFLKSVDRQRGVSTVFVAVSDGDLDEYLRDHLAEAPIGRFARDDGADSDGDAVVIFRLDRE